MDTQTLQQELNERWLALDVEAQELMVGLLRTLTGEQSLNGLPHYKAARERHEKAMAEKFTTFGQLAVGDRFTHFGQEYEKIEPTPKVKWVNCQSDRGQTFMGDDFVVGKRVESQNTQDRTG